MNGVTLTGSQAEYDKTVIWFHIIFLAVFILFLEIIIKMIGRIIKNIDKSFYFFIKMYSHGIFRAYVI